MDNLTDDPTSDTIPPTADPDEDIVVRKGRNFFQSLAETLSSDLDRLDDAVCMLTGSALEAEIRKIVTDIRGIAAELRCTAREGLQ
jgi:hypothetical protein